MNVTYELGIDKITELEFSKKELTSNNEYTATFDVDIKPLPDKKQIDFLLTYLVFNKDLPIDSNVILKFSVKNLFSVPQLQDFEDEKKGQIDLPMEIISSMLSAAISHSRALLSKYINDTPYQIFSIPLIKPTAIVNDLSKKHFESNKENTAAFKKKK